MAPVARHPDEKIPAGFSRTEAVRLLAAAPGSEAADMRACAVITLLCEYGLHASAVCALRLDDLNWRQATLRIRRAKSGRSNAFPLSMGAGESMIRYLQQVRPAGYGRTVFLTLRAPDRSLAWHPRQRSAQPAPRGCTALARPRAVDETIGDYLGHRSICATSVDVKINLNLLREVAEIDLGGLR